MNFSMDKKRLIRYLSLADTIATSKSTLPVLSNILIDAQEGTVSFVSSNLETGITVTDTADVSRNGSLAVNGRKLLSIVRELPESDVQLATDEHNRLSIRSASDEINAEFHIAGIPRSEFPEVKSEPEGEYVQMSADEFRRMIRKVIFSISSDENKYSLTGIYLEKNDGEINMVATDGKRLSLVTKRLEMLKIDEGSLHIPHDGVIVPRIVFNELMKYSFEENLLSMGFSPNQVFFMYDNVRLMSNLIEGKYPDYKKIIPVDRETFFLADREMMISAIRRVSILVDESYNQIKLGIGKTRLVLSAQNPALGGAMEEIAIDYDGEENDIAVNYVYLLDCLKEIESDRVRVEFENSERVISLYGESEDGYINLIMPMKIHS
jgi:DNA polymerase-3 subunit beta